MNRRRLQSKGQMSEAFITAAILSLSGGLQDAYTYLYRDGVFANAETGNIVLLNVNLMRGNWTQAMHYLLPIAAFALGILVSEAIRGHYREAGRFHWRQRVLVIEILLLAIVGWMPTGLNVLANSMVSFSCAMQVQAFRKVTGYAYASTMCIGNMRSGMDALYGFLHTGDRGQLRKSLRYWEIIVLFGIGAGIGGRLVERLGARTIWISCILLAIAFLLMFIREEEREHQHDQAK